MVPWFWLWRSRMWLMPTSPKALQNMSWLSLNYHLPSRWNKTLILLMVMSWLFFVLYLCWPRPLSLDCIVLWKVHVSIWSFVSNKCCFKCLKCQKNTLGHSSKQFSFSRLKCSYWNSICIYSIWNIWWQSGYSLLITLVLEIKKKKVKKKLATFYIWLMPCFPYSATLCAGSCFAHQLVEIFPFLVFLILVMMLLTLMMYVFAAEDYLQQYLIASVYWISH